jgi:phosphoserine phosphatase RsbU/P
MTAADPLLAAMLRLLEGAHLATPDQVPQAVATAAGELGWDATVYLVDYEQRRLTPLPVPGGAGRTGGNALGVDSSLGGLAFQRLRAMHGAEETHRLWVPLVDGVERLGVLELFLGPQDHADDPTARDRAGRLALLVAHMLAVKMPYGDGLDRHRRSQPRSVAAELIWQLLPPLTYGCEGLVVSGVLEPAYEVAGDAFDYSVNGRTAHLLLLDSTGHDLMSGMLTAAALAAARKARREGEPLVEVVRRVDAAVATQLGDERLATGVLAELDLDSGVLTYVNAGHPAPLLLREGRVVKALDQRRRPLLGLGVETVSEPATEQLQPGDRLLLYSDGVTEARTQDGTFFGVDRLVDTLVRGAAAGQRVPETLRRVVHAVLDHQQARLQDDATLLIAEWSGEEEKELFPL